ncbi:MAG: RsbRD N-terminal domain-containing protein [Pyrinomonadaceae bacterium]
MTENFTKLIRQHRDSIIRKWVEEIYRDRRTRLAELLSYEQLVDHLPDFLDAISDLLDTAADEEEIAETAMRLRSHAQVRFRQGVLIDETARELMILRRIFNDFLWREGVKATEGDLWELRDALWRANSFVDELIAQMIVIYAAAMRPPVETRTSIWPPPRRRRKD